MKRYWLSIAVFLFLPLSACNAQSPEEEAGDEVTFELGKDYTKLARAVKTSDPNKIEVVELFWYGCIHCFNLEPKLEDWIPTLADDVNFVRIPAMWADIMEHHAKMFYTNEALGITEQLHGPIFKAMNRDKNQMANENAVLKFVASQGVDAEKYRRAFSSFGVNSQVLQAKSKMGAYGVRGTPEMVVNGKYKLTTRLAGSHERLLEIADYLIEQEREALAQ